MQCVKYAASSSDRVTSAAESLWHGMGWVEIGQSGVMEVEKVEWMLYHINTCTEKAARKWCNGGIKSRVDAVSYQHVHREGSKDII